MNGNLDPDALRELFLASSNIGDVRALALVISVALVVVVLWLVQRRDLREEYTTIWMGVAGALMLLSLRLDWLHALARALGAWTLSSTIFFLGEVFLVIACLHYAVRLSRSSVQIKNLAQEVALLRSRLDSIDHAPGRHDHPSHP
jgi:heme/copper-type cytochrome/quinol oxidase subunit 4